MSGPVDDADLVVIDGDSKGEVVAMLPDALGDLLRGGEVRLDVERRRVVMVAGWKTR